MQILQDVFSNRYGHCHLYMQSDFIGVNEFLHTAKTKESSSAGVGRLQSLSVQALDDYRVSRCRHLTIVEWCYVCIGRLKSHPMPTLTTVMSSSACVGLLWCHPVPALAYCDVIQCRNWPIVKSFNVFIGSRMY